MNARIMYRIIVRAGVMITLFFSMGVLAMTVTPLMLSGGAPVAAHVLAHPPVNGDCVSCHPDVRTMPRIN